MLLLLCCTSLLFVWGANKDWREGVVGIFKETSRYSLARSVGYFPTGCMSLTTQKHPWKTLSSYEGESRNFLCWKIKCSVNSLWSEWKLNGSNSNIENSLGRSNNEELVFKKRILEIENILFTLASLISLLEIVLFGLKKSTFKWFMYNKKSENLRWRRVTIFTSSLTNLYLYSSKRRIEPVYEPFKLDSFLTIAFLNLPKFSPFLYNLVDD